MRAIKTNLPVRQAGMRNTAILFFSFSLFLTLAVFSQVVAKATPDVASGSGKNLQPNTYNLKPSDWLYFKSNNDITAYLGKKSSNLPTVRYQKGNDYLEFSMTGVSSTTAVSLETDVKTPNTPTLFYRNIFDGADANYQITNIPFRVKEEIVLKKVLGVSELGSSLNPTPNTYNLKPITFLFSAETTGKPVKQSDGSIAFFDNQNKYLFQLDKPFMYDANLNRSEAVTIEIIPKSKVLISNKIPSPNNQLFKQFKKFFPSLFNLKPSSFPKTQNLTPKTYTLTLSADSAWLSTAIYPVIIDPTVTHNADANFTGQMNRIADSDTTSSTQLESSYPEATKDPYTVLLLHFNEANGTTAGIRDYASTTRVITANGNASTTSYVTQLGLGNSAAFDGTGDYVTVPDSDDWNFGSGDFSIDTWVNFTSLPTAGDERHLATQWVEGSSNRSFRFGIVESSGLMLLKYTYSTSGSSFTGSISSSAQSLSASKWYHVATVRSSNTLSIYLDGKNIGSGDLTGVTVYNASVNLNVGQSETGGFNLNGYLDSFRIIKGRALTPEEIKAAASRRPYAVYTSPVIDATASVTWNTVNWTEGGVKTGDGEQPYNTNSLVAQWDFNDTSGTTLTASSSGSCTASCNGTLTNFAYTASQDQATTTTGWTANNKKWGAGALMMESVAAADYVSISDPASNALDPGTGDFSVEGWIKSSATGQDTILQNNTTVGACATNAGYILVVNGNRNLAAYASDGATCYVNNLTANASSTEIADGRWHHFAFVADRDTKAYVYYDGRLATSTTINNTTAANPAATIYFGASGATGDSDFILDSARYYSRALSAAEILSNYNAGNIEIQTRTGATSDPNDGSWEAWKPTTNSETQLFSLDNDAVNWHSDIMASTTIATSTEAVIKAEGTGSLKIRTGMASTTAGTVALWHFEETGTTTGTYLYDETANNNDATTTGTTVVDGIFGKARKFDGAGDYVSAANNANFNLSSGDFAIDFWAKSVSSTAERVFFTKGTDNLDVNNSYSLRYDTASDNLRFITSGTLITIPSPKLTTNWQYWAVSRSGSTITIYLDGVSIGSGSPTITEKEASLQIGQYQGVSNEYDFDGIIDEFRIIKGRALSADEIAETYRMGANHHLTRQVSATDLSSANKLAFNVAADRPGTYLETMLGESDYANYELASSTLALSTNTVLYIKGDEIASSTSIKDSSFSGKAITANGNARTAGGGKIGNSVYFDGTSDYLELADNADWDFTSGNGNGAIDFWFYANDLLNARLIGQSNAGADGNWSIYINSSDNDGDIAVSIAGGAILGSATGIIKTGKWTHVAVVKDGSTTTIYLNGVSIAAGTGTYWNNATTFLRIAARAAADGDFNGYLDEVRIIKGSALTADQIRQAYEYGLRTHPITIDFGATLQTSDLISSATDYNFSLTATTSGLSATTSGLYLGDKIIIKENLGGTEYTAQGTVNSINTTTGAITVPSWDSGSTFPASNGYSPNATVFKWQREYFDLGGSLSTHRDAITNLTLRPTNGAEGRTIYLDDFRYNTNYLTASSSSAITSGNNRYLQYRAIFTSTDTFVSPFLTAFNTLYTALAQMFPPLIGISGGGFLSF